MADRRRRGSGEIGGPRRPRDDEPLWRHWLWRIDWAWRRIVPLLAVAMAAYSVLGVESKVERQREGRRVAVDVLCGGLSGVGRAGRLTLLDRLPGVPPQPRPEPAWLVRRRRAAARSYVRIVLRGATRQAGVHVPRIIRSDGTLDCDRLRRAAIATGPPPEPTP